MDEDPPLHPPFVDAEEAAAEVAIVARTRTVQVVMHRNLLCEHGGSLHPTFRPYLGPVYRLPRAALDGHHLAQV